MRVAWPDLDGGWEVMRSRQFERRFCKFGRQAFTAEWMWGVKERRIRTKNGWMVRPFADLVH